MGYDKYGLDWNLWGSTPAKKDPASESTQPTETIGKNWSSDKKQPQCSEEPPAETNKSEQLTLRLLSAKLILDNETDFLQPCKFQVKADRNVNGKAHIELFGLYEKTEYPVRISCDVNFTRDTAEGAVKLEYVEKFYDDYFGNGKIEAVVNYLIKASAKGASEISGDKLQMPMKSQSGVSLHFYEYPYAHESKLTSEGVPKSLLQNLSEYHSTALLTATRTGPVLVDDKWIYVFTKKGAGVSLTWECKISASSQNQSFHCVSWAEKDRDTNGKTYPRAVKGAAKNQLRLASENEYYILISKIQLRLCLVSISILTTLIFLLSVVFIYLPIH